MSAFNIKISKIMRSDAKLGMFILFGGDRDTDSKLSFEEVIKVIPHADDDDDTQVNTVCIKDGVIWKYRCTNYYFRRLQIAVS